MFERIGFFQRTKPAITPSTATPAAQGDGRELRRKRQLKLRQKLGLRQTADFYYLIDVVGTCNLRCPSCPVGNYPELPPKGLMALSVYQSILDKIAAEHPDEKVFVDLYNWGEPGLHKHLGEIIALTRKFGFGVGISSNLNVFPDLKAVVQARPTYLRISLSGFFNETYQRTHKAGDVNLVKANMHMLRYWLDKTGSDTIVQVGYHVYRSNFPDDFFRMRDLCEELDFIFAPTLAALMPVEKAVAAVDGKSLPADQELLDNLVVSTGERVALLSQARPRYQDCQYRQKRTTINYDGSVPLCCATFEQEQIIASSFLSISRAELTERKYQHDFCRICQERSLDMVYTGVEPHLVDEKAIAVLGPEFKAFLDEWNVSLEPSVDWNGAELSIQEAYDTAQAYAANGDSPSAEKLYAELLEAAPRHGEASYQLGLLLSARGRTAEALEKFEAALEVWPDHDRYVQAVREVSNHPG